MAGNSAIPVTRKVEVVNTAPQNLETASELNIAENLPVGEVVGVLRATDRNGDVLQYGFALGVGDGGNKYFTMDPNGTLRTAVRFDYEEIASALSVRIFARDPYDEKVEGNFTISLVDVWEDIDGDGVTDHLDDDMDGDGFSNEEEVAFGSDPMDSRSGLNHAPEDIMLKNGGQVLENQPAGTLVARFAGVDPDKNDTLSYSIVDPKVKTNFPFKLFTLGGLRTTRVLDYETDEHNYSLTIGVMDERNETF